MYVSIKLYSHIIEFVQHDVRVHLTGVVPLHLGVTRGTTGEPDQRRGGRPRRLVRGVVGTSGLSVLSALGGRGDGPPEGLRVARRDGLGAGAGRRWEVLSLVGDHVRHRRLGQHPGFPGAGVDPGHDLGGRIPQPTVAGRVPQTGGQGDRAWGLPGVGRGDRGGAVGGVLDPSSPDLDRSEASGEVGIVLGHGQFQADLGLEKEAVVWELDGLGGDRSLKPLRGTPGDVLDWRGGVAMRALPRTPSQILRARAQTGDRQEIF